MDPIVNGLEQKYGREFKVVRANIDTAQGKKLAREYGAIGQPTIIMVDRSGQEARRFQGEYSAEKLQQAIEQILNKETAHQ